MQITIELVPYHAALCLRPRDLRPGAPQLHFVQSSRISQAEPEPWGSNQAPRASSRGASLRPLRGAQLRASELRRNGALDPDVIWANRIGSGGIEPL